MVAQDAEDGRERPCECFVLTPSACFSGLELGDSPLFRPQSLVQGLSDRLCFTEPRDQRGSCRNLGLRRSPIRFKATYEAQQPLRLRLDVSMPGFFLGIPLPCSILFLRRSCGSVGLGEFLVVRAGPALRLGERRDGSFSQRDRIRDPAKIRQLRSQSACRCVHGLDGGLLERDALNNRLKVPSRRRFEGLQARELRPRCSLIKAQRPPACRDVTTLREPGPLRGQRRLDLFQQGRHRRATGLSR